MHLLPAWQLPSLKFQLGCLSSGVLGKREWVAVSAQESGEASKVEGGAQETSQTICCKGRDRLKYRMLPLNAGFRAMPD